MELVIDICDSYYVGNEVTCDSVVLFCTNNKRVEIIDIPFDIYIQPYGKNAPSMSKFKYELETHLAEVYIHQNVTKIPNLNLKQENRPSLIKSIEQVLHTSAVGYSEELNTTVFWKITYNYAFVGDLILKYVKRSFDAELEVYEYFRTQTDHIQAKLQLASFDAVDTSRPIVPYAMFKPESQKIETVFRSMSYMTVDIENPAIHYNDLEFAAFVHPIACIGCVYVDKNNEKTRKVFAWGTVKSEKHEMYASEKDMLHAFNQWFKQKNPDCLVGFNSNRFDFPYIFGRFDKHHIEWTSIWSKLRGVKPYINKRSEGYKGVVSVICPGRVFIDVMMYCKNLVGLKLDEYSLNSIARHYDIGQKDDILPSKLYSYFYTESAEKREKFFDYCLQDVELTWLLTLKLAIIEKHRAKCQIVRSRFADALDRGTGYLIGLFLHAECNNEVLIPYQKEGHPPKFMSKVKGHAGIYQLKINKLKHTGAHVFDPKNGLHEGLIMTGDFGSLYPSIIRTFNLSSNTMLPYDPDFDYECKTEEADSYWETESVGSEERSEIDEDEEFDRLQKQVKSKMVGKAGTKIDIKLKDLWNDGIKVDKQAKFPERWTTPYGFSFVKSEARLGILPMLCKLLVEKRKEVRDQAETCTDQIKKKSLEIYADELKILANSIYGQTGAIFSPLCNVAIAISITALGKKYILKLKEALETEYCLEKLEYPHHNITGEIIYGDTDSLFIKIRKYDLNEDGEWIETQFKTDEERWDCARRLKKFINIDAGIVHGNLAMGIDDVSTRVILYTKKKYFKYRVKDPLVEDPKFKYVKTAGIVTRSVFLYCRNTIAGIFKMYADGKSILQIKEYITEAYRKLLAGEVENEELLQTAKLSKNIDEYKKGTEMHVLCARMLKYANLKADKGDRIAYYICCSPHLNAKKSECAIPELLMYEYSDDDKRKQLYCIDYSEYAKTFSRRISDLTRDVFFKDRELLYMFDLNRYYIYKEDKLNPFPGMIPLVTKGNEKLGFSSNKRIRKDVVTSEKSKTKKQRQNTINNYFS